MNETKTLPAFTSLINLAAEKIGAKVLWTTDDFFAEKENLIKPGRGIFIADKYTDRGKWMDGWESRRKRTPGHDACILQLGTPGVIKGFDIDTNHFLGNHPPFASVEACYEPNFTSIEDLEAANKWTEILAKSPLDPGSQHFFEIANEQKWTHLKLHIYPDGGVARFKVYGNVFKDWSLVDEGTEVDLIAAVNGGKSVLCNDMFFSHMDNLIMPERGANMGDGWETKRNRIPNNRDWVIVKLGTKGTVDRLLIDTCHFKGNYPDTCSLEGANIENDDQLESADWAEILPKSKLSADHEHLFVEELKAKGPFSHVRLNIFPDGGISRMRLFGKVSNKL